METSDNLDKDTIVKTQIFMSFLQHFQKLFSLELFVNYLAKLILCTMC